MRKRREFKAGRCYHLVSRIANCAFFLTDDERTRFVDRMWRVARFSGVNFFTASYSTTFTPPLGSVSRVGSVGGDMLKTAYHSMHEMMFGSGEE